MELPPYQQQSLGTASSSKTRNFQKVPLFLFSTTPHSTNGCRKSTPLRSPKEELCFEWTTLETPRPVLEQEPSSDVGFQDLNVYGDQILAKYGMNTKYNQFHPIYLHPTNSKLYFPLTSGNVEKWAKALRSRIPGVSLIAPPNSIKFKTQPKDTNQPSPPSSVHGADRDALTN
ncbi:hypothetical protein PCASD_26110 [Puccinia coronata f. sp. avenae]|uniref:Uncharacterized protein n=1 Tax=Puccinia coronata f. sp. avenae TaxID=200324 RepID=A0A2N5RWB3_9BASI|nr:hypothetical protein PCASD_26110 [Puccinia coronata f. sp. avenae]